MKTLASYDAIPYDSIPITETHVDHLAAISRVYGWDAPDPARCRVLELGCAEGGNLLPMAFYLSQSEFVGIDLSQHQIDLGQQAIDALQLKNIRLLHRDVLEGVADLGAFDFIIAHGLYSWVPPAVREKMLALCAAHLSPNGVAYISFNTLPGWRSRGMMRDLLLWHTREVEGPRAKLDAALALLAEWGPAFAAQNTPEGQIMAGEAAYLQRAPQSYVFHEYLAEFNAPFLFTDFVSAAQAQGLHYLGDAELSLPSDGPDPLAHEQRQDFLTARKFRRALLTRAAVTPRKRSDFDSALQNVAYMADLGSEAELDLSQATPQSFETATGQICTITHPLAKVAAMLLTTIYPASAAYADMLAQAQHTLTEYGGGSWAQDEAGFLEEWAALCAQRAVRLASRAQNYPADLPERPCTHGLARWQATHGEVAGVRHQSLELDILGRTLMLLCDGTRDIAALTADMARHTQNVGESLPETALSAAVNRMLWQFQRAGLFA